VSVPCFVSLDNALDLHDKTYWYDTIHTTRDYKDSPCFSKSTSSTGQRGWISVGNSLVDTFPGPLLQHPTIYWSCFLARPSLK
jgi:hypothetical protein